MTFASLGSTDSRGLEGPFLEEEVFAALSCVSRDKALGPNGFKVM